VKAILYLVTLLLNIRVFANSNKSQKTESIENNNCPSETKVIVIDEQDFIKAVGSKKIIENFESSKVLISNDLYNYLRNSGKIKTLESLDSVNCGERDCTIK
jgi:hypothetical protein